MEKLVLWIFYHISHLKPCLEKCHCGFFYLFNCRIDHLFPPTFFLTPNEFYFCVSSTNLSIQKTNGKSFHFKKYRENYMDERMIFWSSFIGWRNLGGKGLKVPEVFTSFNGVLIDAREALKTLQNSHNFIISQWTIKHMSDNFL